MSQFLPRRECPTRKAVKLYLGDENKEFLENQNVFFSYPNGTSIPISPTEMSDYRISQGWIKDLNNIDSGKPIKILIRAIWENEIGKKFDRVINYDLICTKVGNGRSYTFVPLGTTIEDI